MTHADPAQESMAAVDEVFLSYRRRKLPEVSAIARRLESLSVRCWYDLKTSAAADWRNVVDQKINSVRAGIVAFTPDCFTDGSDWVEYEAKVLKRRNAYVPCCIEPSDLQPPFSRDHARQLSTWFRPYAGEASLPMEAGGVTSGPSRYIEWEGVLDSLGTLLGRPTLHNLDLLLNRAADTLFGGDLEYAIERTFTVDDHEAIDATFDDLSHLFEGAGDWLAAAPTDDPARPLVNRLRDQFGLLLKTAERADGRRWSDGAFKGRTVSGASPPGTLFRDERALPTMAVVPPGHFVIGSPVSEIGRSDSEGPQVPVRIEKAFALATTPTTVSQWRRFAEETRYRSMPGVLAWDSGKNSWALAPRGDWREPGFEQADDHPVVGVSWADAASYALWLSDVTGRAYRLPTEAEWEYAARHGVDGPYPWGTERPAGRAHYAEALASLPSGAGTAAVGSFQPSSLGLFDLSGNAWEWCQDSWVRGFADMSPIGAVRVRQQEHRRIARGGGWRSPAADLRIAARRAFPADERNAHVGFRVAASL